LGLQRAAHSAGQDKKKVCMTANSGPISAQRRLSAHAISIASALALVCGILSFVSIATAQQYRTDPIDEKTAKGYGPVAQLCVKDPARYALEQAKVKEYFSNYYFPRMTRTGEQELGQLGKLRYDLFKNVLWPGNEQLQKDLTDLTFDAMLKIVAPKPADPPYHPAVRYNAILTIGMLDESYGIETGPSKRPPVPMTKANDFLTLVVDKGADDVVPPPLVFGAIVGLDRHAQYRDSWKDAPAKVAAMRKALLKLATHEKPIQDMDRDAYSWMRMRAAQVLAKLKGVGEQNSVHNALMKLVATGRSLDDRCNVAGLLDNLEYKDVKLDDAGTAEPLFALARDVAAAEDKRAEDFQNSGAANPGVVVGANGEPLETYPRRQVLARLTGLSKALTKVKPGLPAETQKKVDDLIKAIEPAQKAAGSKDTVELKLADAVRTMAVAVNRTVPPAEKPSADKAAADKKAADTL
jgi:hypothetical protein